MTAGPVLAAAAALIAGGGCEDALRNIGCGPNAMPATYVFASGRAVGEVSGEVGAQPDACIGRNDGPPDRQTLVLDCQRGSSRSGATQVRFGPVDLRRFFAGESDRVDVKVGQDRSGGSCWATFGGAGLLAVTEARGRAAAAPGHVTADFSRQASFMADLDGAGVTWIPGPNEGTDCSPAPLGRLHVTGRLGQVASDYGERPVCH